MSLRSFSDDISIAVRSIRRDWLVSLAIILTLAAAAALNTTIFAFIYAFIFRPLPYENAGRIVEISQLAPQGGSHRPVLTTPTLRELSNRNALFEFTAHFEEASFNIADTDQTPIYVPGMRVSGDLFRILGTVPLHGRTVSPEDYRLENRVVVLGFNLWRRVLGGDPGAVGGTIRIDGTSYVIVGVMPNGFYFYDDTQVWIPHGHPGQAEQPDFVSAIALLREGVSVREAEEGSQSALDADVRLTFFSGSPSRLWVNELGDARTDGGMGLLAWPLQGAAIIVLVLALGNVATLMIARGRRHATELAIRTALGATRRQLMRPMLIEVSALSTFSAVGAIGLAAVGLETLVLLTPLESAPTWIKFQLDAPVLALTLVPIVLLVVLLGTHPAYLSSSIAAVPSMLQGAGVGVTAELRQRKLSRAMVVLSSTGSVVLLSSAAVVFQGVLLISHYDPGFDPDGLVRLSYRIPDPDSLSDEEIDTLFEVAQNAATGLGQVANSAIEARPDPNVIGRSAWRSVALDAGETVEIQGLRLLAVDERYLSTIGLQLIAGRVFVEEDGIEGQLVGAVSASLAARLQPDYSDLLGRELTVGESPPIIVVGVVEDIRAPVSRSGYAGVTALPHLYLAEGQAAASDRSLLLRMENPSAAAIQDVISVVATQAPKLGMPTTTLVSDQVADTIRVLRWITSVVGVFGAAALALAAVGIGSLCLFEVAQRKQEIGVRRALGATQRAVVLHAASGVLRLAAGGALIGLSAMPFMLLLLRRFQFGTTIDAAVSVAFSCAFVAVVSCVAAYVPARTASSVDPVVAIRNL